MYTDFKSMVLFNGLYLKFNEYSHLFVVKMIAINNI